MRRGGGQVCFQRQAGEVVQYHLEAVARLFPQRRYFFVALFLQQAQMHHDGAGGPPVNRVQVHLFGGGVGSLAWHVDLLSGDCTLRIQHDAVPPACVRWVHQRRQDDSRQ
jgi:hypothetical protein